MVTRLRCLKRIEKRALNRGFEEDGIWFRHLSNQIRIGAAVQRQFCNCTDILICKTNIIYPSYPNYI